MRKQSEEIIAAEEMSRSIVICVFLLLMLISRRNAFWFVQVSFILPFLKSTALPFHHVLAACLTDFPLTTLAHLLSDVSLLLCLVPLFMDSGFYRFPQKTCKYTIKETIKWIFIVTVKKHFFLPFSHCLHLLCKMHISAEMYSWRMSSVWQ